MKIWSRLHSDMQGLNNQRKLFIRLKNTQVRSQAKFLVG